LSFIKGEVMKSTFKIFSIILIAFILISCAPQKTKDDTITIWHWMTDRKDAFNELAKKYEAQTGIKVEFKLFFPPDIYSQKVIAAARSGRLPDIFGILGEKKTLASFIRAGYILNLNSQMSANNNQWKNSFYPKALATTTFTKNNSYQTPQGIYGIPIDATVMQFIYNKSLFRKSGLDPDVAPTTFDQFIQYAKTVKEKTGAVGFICGWGEGWLLNALATEWAINLMGQEKFLKTIKGEVPYTDSEWIKVLSLFTKLRESGILAPNITAITNKESEDAFSRKKAAFSFNGSWSVNVYRQLSPDLEYAFFSLPSVSSKHPLKVWGEAGSSFMVNANTSNKEKVIAFLKWLTKEDQQKFLIKETNNLPSVKGCEESLPPILQSLLPTFNELAYPDAWSQNEDSRVIEIMSSGLQQIIMGLKTPQEVAEEIQKKKERLMRR